MPPAFRSSADGFRFVADVERMLDDLLAAAADDGDGRWSSIVISRFQLTTYTETNASSIQRKAIFSKCQYVPRFFWTNWSILASVVF